MDFVLSSSPFGLAAARSLGGVLLVGLAGVIWSQRRSLGSIVRSVYFKRWACWLAITVAVTGATLLGPLPLGLLLSVAAWQATREYARLRAATGEGSRSSEIIALLVAAAPLAVVAGAPLGVLAPCGMAVLGLQMLRHEQERPETVDIPGAAFGYLWIGLGLAHLAALRTGFGPELVVLTCAMVALGDVGAFMLGRALRGPRLAPSISPNKTWSGVAGNALGALLALAVLPFALPVGWSPARAVALALLVAGASVLGDLLESQQKRRAGVKDAGRSLPGFGGLLDRIDSLLLAGPAAYWFVTLS